MQENTQHTDLFLDTFKQAFESYEPEVSASEMASSWKTVKTNIHPIQPTVPNSLLKNITLKGLSYAGAGLAIVATTVILLINVTNKESEITIPGIQNTAVPEIEPQKENIENGLIASQELNLEKDNTVKEFTGDNGISSGVYQDNVVPATSGKIKLSENSLSDQNNKKDNKSSSIEPTMKFSKVVFSDTILCVNDILKIRYNNKPNDNTTVALLLPDGEYLANFTGVKVQRFDKKGIYQVLVEYNVNGVLVKKSHTIHVFDAPEMFFDFDLSNSPVVKFTNFSSSNSRYSWNFGDGTSSEKTNPEKTYTKSGNYQVILKGTNLNGCISEMTKYLTITLSGSEKDIYIPNTFSPNNDGKDDYYFITLDNEILFEITIVDRYGKTVFYSNSKNDRWDGNDYLTGKECQNGSYFFVVKYQSYGQETALKKTGTILLNR